MTLIVLALIDHNHQVITALKNTVMVLLELLTAV